PNHVDRTTMLVLTNAIYFKGLWESQFLKKNTAPDTFHLSATDSTRVDMMKQSGRFRYFDEGSFQALELPYRGGSVCMVVLLPKAVDGLARVEAAMTEPNLGGWLGKLSSHRVQVALPKFRLTEEAELKSALSELGMPLAFQRGSADFSGIAGTRDLAISAVVH